jgi:LAS superfamily LD-carboxypeptidase LdcB
MPNTSFRRRLVAGVGVIFLALVSACSPSSEADQTEINAPGNSIENTTQDAADSEHPEAATTEDPALATGFTGKKFEPIDPLKLPAAERIALYEYNWKTWTGVLTYSNGEIPKEILCEVSVSPRSLLRCDAAASLEKMIVAMEAEGIEFTKLNSGFRSLAEQVAVRKQKGSRIAAVPGRSPHGWGLAIDVPAGPMQWWIRDHGPEYGWHRTIRREPWHFDFAPEVYGINGAF